MKWAYSSGGRCVSALFVIAAAPVALASTRIELANLVPPAGFRIDAGSADLAAPSAIAPVGDVNGDGIDDLLIGVEEFATSGGVTGAAFVVFGRSAGIPPTLSLAALDGSNGFRLDGVGALDDSGRAVAGLGDFNGDGRDDFAIGANEASPLPTRPDAGAVYVVFGRATAWPATLALGSLDGSNGLRIDGPAAGTRVGIAVAGIGDTNGDSRPDLLIGASAATFGGGSFNTGAAYVVFGAGTPFAASFDLATLDGSNGFELRGVAGGDFTGEAVAGAGDVNGDGVRDLLVGAFGADPMGRNFAGSTYLVFGRSTGFPALLAPASLDGTNGVRIDGAAGSLSGRSIAGAGDTNGDGRDDLLIGAAQLDVGSESDAGAAYLVLGRAVFSATLDLTTFSGSDGFVMPGRLSGDLLGTAVAGIGDLNLDGRDDFVIDAARADVGGQSDVGVTHLVFGRPPSGAPSLDLFALAGGGEGLGIVGPGAGARAGERLAGAGDFNRDGVLDVAIGAVGFDPGGITDAGSVYLVFGNAAPLRAQAAIRLDAILEDSGASPARSIGATFAPVYLDAQAFAGLALSMNPPATGGAWQYRLDGSSAWQPLPPALSNANALVLAPAGALRFLPDPDFAGDTAALALRLWDGAGGFAPGSGRDITRSIGGFGGFARDAELVTLVQPIVEVNDAPAFVLAAAANAAEDAGPQLRSAFATDISAGPASELGQGLAFDVVVLGTDASLGFASPPAIDPSGNLRFAAAAESFGTATIEVRLCDDGGTANGGVAVSTPRSFTLSVLAVNDAPSFTAADPAPVPASFGPVTLPNWATGSTGPANESAQTLSYEVVAVSDPTQFAFGPAVTPDGTLRYTPATTAFGTTTVSIRVRDSGGTSAGGVDVSAAQTFSFTISPVVDALFNDGFETRN
jgi:hypothetical protein